MSVRRGMNGKLYRCETLLDGTNTAAQATWIECGNVRDVTVNLETGEADVTTRANNGWRQTVSTLKDGGMEFEMVVDDEDETFTAIRSAWLTSSEVALMALSGAKDEVGSDGIASNFSVTNFSRSEPLEEAMSVSVSLKPSSRTGWWEVGEGETLTEVTT